MFDRSAAVAYAHTWAYRRNPRYFNFDKAGGDCTNFASQCLFAGWGAMHGGAWYYYGLNNRSPSWTGVEFLHTFLTGGTKPRAADVGLGKAEPGDVLQLSFDGTAFAHSLVVAERGANGILVAAHTDDCDYRPLASYSFRKLRALHVV